MPGMIISTTLLCALRFSSLIAHRLNVCVHRDFEICMAQQFLNHFRVLAVGVQDGAERVAKRTLGKPNLLSSGSDIDAEDRIRPIERGLGGVLCEPCGV